MTNSGAGAWAVTRPRQIVAGLFSMALSHGQFQERSLGFVGQIMQFSWRKELKQGDRSQAGETVLRGSESDPHRCSPARPRGEAFSLAIAPRVLHGTAGNGGSYRSPSCLASIVTIFLRLHFGIEGSSPISTISRDVLSTHDSYSVPGT
jgi:hypothetical protein